ncbi:NADH-quinone oxidoreductase subunit NuoK [Salipaludibacillus agaradhaerens]|jgi:NADH-quinone oxidoreductase subunit K|uniref:NADH-quinone oxidoreductase subunit K n=1 Tax=Salipaludibacillus agaradhaerens TaxID=76935 RepID=A0A9Q4B5A2_SALAG|nr:MULTISPECIES: NADH-quinone oxidoreductase subunit NuoK [Salipaludibacillus]MCR6098541.1 NADH-quinone oxidoreductase subunit NuoK [Salipaludibacillus agaradhaerens]MCR6115548.1 NADH-quinone oxidoreductase subunit NuoK [Salipaludibacillus agaradhaerens]UTR16250.1 NADH-quinone oxidoreductase subunit NuoK [Salipaludibacillus sp. LMS25]
MVPITLFLALAAILFCVGLYGVLTRRHLVIVLASIELMLNSVNINLVAFSAIGPFANISGQVFTLFVITVAAAEAAVGLAILIALYRNRHTIDVIKHDLLRW